MKPYYEEPGIQIFCGDCRDILPQLGPVDVVITDPPYADSTHDGARTDSSGKVDNLIDFNSVTSAYLRSTYETIACRRWLVSFTDYHHAIDLENTPPSGLRFVRLGLWVKPNPAPQFTGDRPGMGWEAIAFLHSAHNRLRWNGGGCHSVFTELKINGGHPTEKPIRLLMRLVRLFSDPSEVILDPFMGSGTTLVAAKNLGRRAIGIEIERKYCDIAIDRLRQGVLFPAQPKNIRQNPQNSE